MPGQHCRKTRLEMETWRVVCSSRAVNTTLFLFHSWCGDTWKTRETCGRFSFGENSHQGLLDSSSTRSFLSLNEPHTWFTNLISPRSSPTAACFSFTDKTKYFNQTTEMVWNSRITWCSFIERARVLVDLDWHIARIFHQLAVECGRTDGRTDDVVLSRDKRPVLSFSTPALSCLHFVKAPLDTLLSSPPQPTPAAVGRRPPPVLQPKIPVPGVPASGCVSEQRASKKRRKKKEAAHHISYQGVTIALYT